MSQATPTRDQRTIQKWFNTGVYSAPATATFGNARRDSINSPAYRDVDVNVSRNFPLPGERSLQFRGELFNALNHPNFGLPGATYGTSSFGQITSALDPRDIQFALKLYF